MSQAGLVLGNRADSTKLCPMYSIDCIIEDNSRNNIHHYIDNLSRTKIGGAPDIFTIKTYHFASLLYCFDDFNDKYRSTNMVTKIILIIGRKFDTNIQMLKE